VSTELTLWTALNIGLSFVAAVCGVVVVFPRRGQAIDIRAIRPDFLKMQLSVGRAKLIDTKLEILEADEDWLTIRGWWARAGFVALTLSIAFALVNAIVPGGPSSNIEPAPSPSSSVIQ
jgi:hypothetical protein